MDRRLDTEAPEKLRYTKYYEHDGALRAYANRMMWFGISAVMISFVLALLFFWVRVQPPTVIRIAANGDASVVSGVATAPRGALESGCDGFRCPRAAGRRRRTSMAARKRSSTSSPAAACPGREAARWRSPPGTASSICRIAATPLHCHSLEEELFVPLDGDGTLLLGDEEVPVRAGHIVARPPGTGVAHAFRAGKEGLEFLAYGTRHPGDACYYPRSNKISFRGLGVIARLERLNYWDGEE